jgi:hypothetical protein
MAVSPDQLQKLDTGIADYVRMLEQAQAVTPDPKVQEQLRSIQDLLRRTHAQFKERLPEFQKDMKARLQKAQKQLAEAEKKCTEAAAARQKALDAVAARGAAVKEVDPILQEKVNSPLLEDFGNRVEGPASKPPVPPGGKDVWQK